mmetsp:Transcript_8904/g.21616  ORF Transcript_8904/g.21616 Transcript_8904/m.21616 type:complete len:356 (+) Transcript_8904:70-1137(+)
MSSTEDGKTDVAGECATAPASATRTSSSTAPTNANLALSNPSSRKPRKRAKVTFTAEVISKDDTGNGSKVVVKEEHGIFLGPLLGRMVVSSDPKQEATDTPEATMSSCRPVVSFESDCLTNEKLASIESPHGILKPADSAQPLGDSNVNYDNLVVQMGLIKCGHRYRSVVPVPDHWKQEGDKAAIPHKEAADQINTQSCESYDMDVRISEDSLDDDLRGEVQTEYADASESTELPLRQHHVSITLSARRRGPYRGRFVLELTRRQGGKIKSQSTSLSGSAQEMGEIRESRPDSNTTASLASKAAPIPQKCLMSLQVDATIMGKDMGTPKLRNGVVCLGKMVGYDSDEETEWQGFD